MIPTVEPGLRWYRCTVLAEGPVAGRLDTVERTILGDETIGSAKLALRWLHDQAVRIANGLDPEQIPGPSAGDMTPAARLLARITDPAGDVPAELRAWAADPAAQQIAREELTVTGRTRISVRDSSGRYWLAAQRVTDPAQLPALAMTPGPPDADRRRHARQQPRRAVAGYGSP